MSSTASAVARGAGDLSLPDPRPKTVFEGGDYYVRGAHCPACGHAHAVRVPWCPRCRADTIERLYGPLGTVWSATVVHIPLPNRTPPYSLAYVDLENGPRVLAHVAAPQGRLKVGQGVSLTAATANGDVQVTTS